MKRKMLLALVLCLCSCGGGGGGGGSDSAFLGGVYTGAVELFDRNCPSVPTQTNGYANWTVNQDSERIVVDTPQGGHAEGQPTGEDSFKATSQWQDGDCLDEATFVVNGITDTSAFGIFTASVTCGGVNCWTVFRGDLSRTH